MTKDLKHILTDAAWDRQYEKHLPIYLSICAIGYMRSPLWKLADVVRRLVFARAFQSCTIYLPPEAVTCWPVSRRMFERGGCIRL